MMKRVFLILSILASLSAGLLLPSPALAATDPFSQAGCGQASDSAVCKTSAGDPLTGPNGVLIKATNIVAMIAGIAAVIFLILAGMKYITSGGEAAETAKAKTTIIYLLVGIAIIVLARQIISFVLGKI